MSQAILSITDADIRGMVDALLENIRPYQEKLSAIRRKCPHNDVEEWNGPDNGVGEVPMAQCRICGKHSEHGISGLRS